MFSVIFSHFYSTAIMRTVQLLVLFLLVTLFFSEVANNEFSPKTLFFLSAFFIFEVFFRFKLSQVRPTRTVSQVDEKSLFYACTKPVMCEYYASHTTEQLIKRLIRTKQASFLLQHSEIVEKDIKPIELAKKALLIRAFNLTKQIQGIYITSADIIAAYLLACESQTQLLFKKQLKENDFLTILQWARREFPYEERIHKVRVYFNEEGIGESLVSGWTLETKKYTQNITSRVLFTKPFITGREKEYKRLLEVLSKPDNNNVMIVGDRGSGKSALIESLAYESILGIVEYSSLKHKRILEFMIGPFIAGATNRNELEERLQGIIAEISHAGNVILYIPEFQNLIGSSSFNVNISGALYPYLRDGAMPIITSVTPSDYKKYIENDPLHEVMEVIRLQEPDEQTAISMLCDKSEEIEIKTRTIISFRAISSAVKLGNRYIQNMFLPGSAVSLLLDTAHSVGTSKTPFFGNTARKMVAPSDIESMIKVKTNVSVAAPDEKEKEILLHLEEKLQKRVIDQGEAIKTIAEALRRLRTGLVSETRPVSFLFLGPTGVGKTETAKALADLYYGGQSHMIRLDMSEYSQGDSLKRLLGASAGEGDDRGEFTEQVYDHPFSLILLDEFEKAHPSVLDLFLQVFEDGRLTDNKGRTVSFLNSIIIATSNAASVFIQDALRQKTSIDNDFEKKLIEYLENEHIFKPELLNRFDSIVTFKPLKEEALKQIVRLLLTGLVKKMQEKDIQVTFDDSVIEKIVREGYDEQFGARPMRRYIQNSIEDLLAQKILSNQMERGSTVRIIVDQADALSMKISQVNQ